MPAYPAQPLTPQPYKGDTQLRIPAGLRDGQEVRTRELGGPGRHGGAPGDLYVTVQVTD
ncbi:DnaJ C-terminal domain-containing protein [Streptomyces sp. NPDC127066]|uniref:DnaJ C-terminal domain-containing protein n=1 Tax=Streptomyces sp. NPDC127066 TaxID=3347125 RepID=UPI003655BA75